MEHDPQPEAYLLDAWIRDIHPMLWRRFLVRSDERARFFSLWFGDRKYLERGLLTTASDELHGVAHSR
jgi:hypothetical protein